MTTALTPIKIWNRLKSSSHQNLWLLFSNCFQSKVQQDTNWINPVKPKTFNNKLWKNYGYHAKWSQIQNQIFPVIEFILHAEWKASMHKNEKKAHNYLLFGGWQSIIVILRSNELKSCKNCHVIFTMTEQYFTL